MIMNTKHETRTITRNETEVGKGGQAALEKWASCLRVVGLGPGQAAFFLALRARWGRFWPPYRGVADPLINSPPGEKERKTLKNVAFPGGGFRAA